MIEKANSPRRKKYPHTTTARVPVLRHHKASGQGYVVLNGQAVYLGKFGKAETSQKYHRTIAEWIDSGRQLRQAPEIITVKEVVSRFWIHAEEYYRGPDGKLSSEVDNFKLALAHRARASALAQ